MIDTFIIVVTYNGMKWIGKSLASIPPKYEVVVVDNASRDSTVQFIEENFPDIIVFPEKENLGFGKANNKGIRYALENGAEHIFLLNQDAYLLDDTLESLIELQKSNPDFGILSPIHLTAKKDKLDANFAKFVSPEYNSAFYSDHVLKKSLQDIYEVPFVNAAAWLLSKKCIDKVGGFDPLFYHYGEDDNYCQRVRYHGMKVGIAPNAYVIHDRENRMEKLAIPGTALYFEKILLSYKILSADINNQQGLNIIDKRRLKSGLFAVIALLTFQFKEAKLYYKEFIKLYFLRPKIAKSRNCNKKIGRIHIND